MRWSAGTGLPSCGNTAAERSQKSEIMTEPEFIDPSQIRPRPIRHESSPLEPLSYNEAVFDVIVPYLGMTLKQFEIIFMRDSDPKREVIVWRSITAAWQAYHEKFLGNETLSDNEDKKLFGALILISTGVEDVTKLNVPLAVGRKLIQCYEDLAKE